MANRKKLTPDIKHLVLHEAGYKCGNPVCRIPLTLEIHHLDPVSLGGGDTPDNLLALCPNCHTHHHNGHISIESLKTWKMILLSLNEAFDRNSIDVLLAVSFMGNLHVSGDGVLTSSGLVASGLVTVSTHSVYPALGASSRNVSYILTLSDKGKHFIECWKSGDQSSVYKMI